MKIFAVIIDIANALVGVLQRMDNFENNLLKYNTLEIQYVIYDSNVTHLDGGNEFI